MLKFCLLFRIGITQELCKKEYLAELQNVDNTKDLKDISILTEKKKKLMDRKTKIECASSNSLLEGVYYLHYSGPHPVGSQLCGNIGRHHQWRHDHPGLVESPSRTYYAYCAKATETKIKKQEAEKLAVKLVDSFLECGW